MMSSGITALRNKNIDWLNRFRLFLKEVTPYMLDINIFT